MRSPATTFHVSNALTYASLGAGIASVAAACAGSHAGAGTCLAIAALADTFDGRFARLFSRSREVAAIGVQLDSLVDAVSFGVAPVAALGILLSRDNAAPGFFWLAAALYACGALTRLACYNVSHDDDAGVFVGLPTPVAALVWSTVLLGGPSPAMASGVAIALAIAMVAPIPIARPAPTGLALFAMWPLGLIVTHFVRW
jgi:phosphatidylserine synthase